MKDLFKIILISILTCFSFYYTDRIIDLSKSKDPLMKSINQYKEKNEISYVNGILKKRTMLVGASGYKVENKESYKKMKVLDEFNEALLEYTRIKPAISKKDNLDKLIEGKNTNKKEISLVFYIEDIDIFKQASYILKERNTSATFFMDGALLSKNIDLINKDLEKSTIGLYSYNNKYDEISLRYVKGLISNINHSNYCLYINDKFLNTCIKYKLSTIKPVIIKTNLYNYLKDNKQNGYIYQINLNKINIKELNSTIIYLKQKGYNVLNINKLLKE